MPDFDTFSQTTNWDQAAQKYGGKIIPPQSDIQPEQGLPSKVGDFLMNIGYGANVAALNTVSTLFKLNPLRLVDKIMGTEDLPGSATQFTQELVGHTKGLAQEFEQKAETPSARAGQVLGKGTFVAGELAMAPRIPGEGAIKTIQNPWTRKALQSTLHAAEGVKDIGVFSAAERGEAPTKGESALGAGLGVAAPPVVKGAIAATKAIKGVLNPGVERLITSAVNPTLNRAKQFKEALPKVMSDIAEYSPNNLTGMRTAIRELREKVWGNVKVMLKEGSSRELEVDGDRIANRILEATNNPKVQRESPQMIEALKRKADTYRGKISIEDAEDILEQTNAELESFYRANKSSQKLAESNPEKHADLLLVQELRKQLDEQLSQLGPSFKGLKEYYGALASLGEQVERRWLQAEGRNVLGLAEQLGYAQAGGRFFADLFTGHPVRALGDLGQAGLARWLKILDTPDNKIQRAFEMFKSSPNKGAPKLNDILRMIPREPPRALPAPKPGSPTVSIEEPINIPPRGNAPLGLGNELPSQTIGDSTSPMAPQLNLPAPGQTVQRSGPTIQLGERTGQKLLKGSDTIQAPGAGIENPNFTIKENIPKPKPVPLVDESGIIPKAIDPDDLAIMNDFTEYVAKEYKPSAKVAKQLELDASTIAEKYGIKVGKTIKSIANAFGKVLEKNKFKKK